MCTVYCTLVLVCQSEARKSLQNRNATLQSRNLSAVPKRPLQDKDSSRRICHVRSLKGAIIVGARRILGSARNNAKSRRSACVEKAELNENVDSDNYHGGSSGYMLQATKKLASGYSSRRSFASIQRKLFSNWGVKRSRRSVVRGHSGCQSLGSLHFSSARLTRESA
jgi:hypothetical protein